MTLHEWSNRAHGSHEFKRSLVLCLTLLTLAAPASAVPPDEGDCPTISGGETESGEDAAPLLLKPGMRVDHQGILALQSLMPAEVWRHRDVFFFEGMLMEIGPCHRRYPVPDFYRKATEELSDQVSVDRKGNLKGYVAGVPFPPEQIDLEDSDAATKWAWNLEKRFRGAGPRGRFRINHFPSRMGATLRFEGDFFLFQVAGRADLKDTDYRVPGHDKMIWAGGGLFTKPFDARELAWRQFRSPKSEDKWTAADDIFAYLPALRKVRRAATPWVEGAYMPRFTVAGQPQGSGGIAIGGGDIPPLIELGIHPGDESEDRAQRMRRIEVVVHGRAERDEHGGREVRERGRLCRIVGGQLRPVVKLEQHRSSTCLEPGDLFRFPGLPCGVHRRSHAH